MCSMEAQISQQEGTLYVDSGRVQSSRTPDTTVRQHARLRDARYRYITVVHVTTCYYRCVSTRVTIGN